VVVTEDDPALLFAGSSRRRSPPPPARPPIRRRPPSWPGCGPLKQSVLDRTLDEYKRLSALVDGGDRQRLQAHMDAIREVERGLTSPRLSGAVSMSCKKPDDARQRRLRHRRQGPDRSAHPGARLRSQPGGVAAVAQLVRPVHLDGVDIAHHDLSHQQGNAGADAKLTKVVQWFAGQAAYLLGG
jgi:hypothetical protein